MNEIKQKEGRTGRNRWKEEGNELTRQDRIFLVVFLTLEK